MSEDGEYISQSTASLGSLYHSVVQLNTARLDRRGEKIFCRRMNSAGKSVGLMVRSPAVLQSQAFIVVANILECRASLLIRFAAFATLKARIDADVRPSEDNLGVTLERTIDQLGAPHLSAPRGKVCQYLSRRLESFWGNQFEYKPKSLHHSRIGLAFEFN